MMPSGPNPKSSQGPPASQQQSQSHQLQQTVGQSYHSPGGNGREQRDLRNARSFRRKGSDSSVPEEDKDKKEETTGREPNSENELKTRSSNVLKSAISKMEDDEKPVLKGPKMNDTSTLIRCISPWAELQSAEDIKKGALKESGQTLTNEEEELVALTQITQSPLHQTSLIPDMAQSGTLENSKNAVKGRLQSAAV
ncbi:hypothetical protein XENOCAPTIV_010573 [Xenoophorus captivus]|uniref:Uncharacterized protein n=1 Tax=Xenoophorus captivus TaxID=1517983 RepID=A0ABV0RPW8_9TELE